MRIFPHVHVKYKINQKVEPDLNWLFIRVIYAEQKSLFNFTNVVLFFPPRSVLKMSKNAA